MGSEEGTISEEDVTALLGEFYHDVLGLVTARPSPRNSVDDYVQMTLLTAPFAVYDDWPADQAHLLSKAGTGPARGIVLHQIVIQELLAKLRVWRTDGVPRHLPDTISSQMRAPSGGPSRQSRATASSYWPASISCCASFNSCFMLVPF